MAMTEPRVNATGAEQWRLRTARRISDELRGDARQPRLAKVSSMLHAFRGTALHCDIDDVIRGLQDQGVVVSSHRAEISRRDVLEVQLDSQTGADTRVEARVRDSGVRVSRWSVGRVGELEPLDPTRLGDRPGDGEILWLDVDAQGHDPSGDAVHTLTRLLQPLCPGLTPVMVRDLLTPDLLPKTETYGDERTGVRTVSVPALIAREIPDDGDGFDGVDEQLIIQMVELAVGPNWLITCWHDTRTLVGNGIERHGPPMLREPFRSHVAHRWIHDPASGPGAAKGASDLALYLTRSLVATYGASLRMLQRWVSSWEVGFYQTLGEGDDRDSQRREVDRKSLRGAAVEISNFLSIVGEFSRSVNAFKLAGDEMPNDTWFTDSNQDPRDNHGDDAVSDQAKILASIVEATATKLSHLYDEIRADMDLLMIQSQARQQAASERLQSYLGKVTGLVLVPTFVAGLYGANTALPWGGTWVGFEIMLVLMVLSAAISYLVIRKLMA